MPVHNQLPFTRACLSSIFADPPVVPYEIIVVDDASTDDTWAALSSQPEYAGIVRLVRNSANLGFARSCNIGARGAAGAYLLFLNNDTEARHGWFRPLYETLEMRPDIGIVGARLLFPDGTIQHCGKVWHDVAAPDAHPSHLYYKAPGDLPGTCRSREFQMVTGACMLVRRDEFFRFGPFDERYLNGWEDDDLCYSFRAAGKKVWYCAESVLIHHQGKSLDAEVERLSTMLAPAAAAGGQNARPHELSTLVGEARQKVQEKVWGYQANRALFFSKWQQMIESDAGRYLREDGDLQAGRLPPGGGRVGGAASIVIVTYNSAGTISACLESVARNLRPGDEVIVVDNASRDETVALVERFAAGASGFLLVASDRNLGFSAGTNLGIRRSANPFVVLLNPDTVVTTGWLDGLQAHFAGEGVAAVGPVSNYVAALQQMPLYQKGALSAGISPDDVAARFREWNGGRGVDTRLLIGFCLMLRRDILARVGLLNEDLFLGNDDLELSWRLRANEYRLVVATDVFIFHEGQQSFATESESLTLRLVRESTERLYSLLVESYGSGRVPAPQELWGIDWFTPAAASFNPATRILDFVVNPGSLPSTQRL
jgi:GT2 family glycosyltransferase